MHDERDAIRAGLAISCADALELMTDHLEDALSKDDARRLHRHLDGCEACALYLDQLRTTITVLHGTGPVDEFPVDADRLTGLLDLFREARGRR